MLAETIVGLGDLESDSAGAWCPDGVGRIIVTGPDFGCIRQEMSISQFSGEFRFLSNFSPSMIVYEGVIYPTVEHAYQAAKSLNYDERRRIAGLSTPGKAKAAGQKVFLRPDWEDVKIDIMRRLVWIKFQIPELGEMLLATGDKELIEGNWWHDGCYGVCNCERCKGVGENWLGRILMEVRGWLNEKNCKV